MFETVPRPSATHKVAGLDVVWVLGLDGGINCIPPYKKQDLTPLLRIGQVLGHASRFQFSNEFLGVKGDGSHGTSRQCGEL